jgi:hypothetical protein
MNPPSNAQAVKENDFRDSGHFCATAARQWSVIAKKYLLERSGVSCRTRMISLSRRARIRGKICGEFLQRVFTAVGFL